MTVQLQLGAAQLTLEGEGSRIFAGRDPTTWMEFFEAVDDDPAADALLERGVERLGRTLEIIFGEDKTIDFRHLPVDLMRRFE